MTRFPARPGPRRLVLVALALVLPLGTASVTATAAVASDQARTAATAMSSAEVARLVAEAVAAEEEAEAAVDAVPVARDRIAPLLKKAQDARDRVQPLQKPVDRGVKQVNQRQKLVKKQAKRVQNRVKALKRATGPKAKRVARVKLRKARTNVQKSRANLRKARTNLQKHRANLRAARAVNERAWAAWREARDAHQDALAHVDVAAGIAAQKREAADRAVAAITTVTGTTVTVLPPVRQPSASTAAADRAQRVVHVAATPSVPYLDVKLQRQQGASWTTVATTETQAGGRVDVPVAQDGTYRAVVDGFTSAPAADERRVLFSDEFTGNTLDDVWVHRAQGYLPDSFRKCAKGSPEAVSQTSDTVRLWVKKDPVRKDTCMAPYRGELHGPHSYRINGHIGTQGTFSFTYGVAAARLKFQTAAEGQHAAFWLQPQSYSGLGPGPANMGAEIDVVEFNGYLDGGRAAIGRGVWYINDQGVETHVGGMLTKQEAERYMADKDDKWFNRYHVFSVEWTPTEYVYRIDGDEFFRTSEGISQRPQYPILSLLSSDYSIARAGADGEKQLGTQHMDVDWIRVWQ